MPLALNTGHPLYGNLKMLIGVDDSNLLVDLVTPARAFTTHASSVYGAGSMGRHFGVRRSGYTTYGASFDFFATGASNTGTLLIVTNAVRYGENAVGSSFIGRNSASVTTYAAPQLSAQGASIKALCHDGAGGTITASAAAATSAYIASPLMMTLTRNSTTSHAIYVNGNTTPEVSGGKLGSNETFGRYEYIGGVNGIAPMDFDLVWAAWFDVVLTPTQVSDLYTSLGASNAFALVTSGGGGATATTLTGPTSGTNGVASTNFTSGANGTITGTVTVTPNDGGQGGTFTPTSVAISSGTPTATFTYTPASTGVKTISTTNNGGLTPAASIAYTSNAAGDVTAPTQTGTITVGTVTSTSIQITWPAGADNVAVTSYETSPNGTTWTDRGNVLTYTFTGLTASTSYTFRVRAKDAAGNVSTPALQVTQSTAAAATVTYLSDIFTNNTGTVQPSVSVNWSWFAGGRIGSLAGITPTEGVGTTSGTGRLTVTVPAAGAGVLMASIRSAGPTTDAVYYEAGTAA
jgi:hypothetical protein